MSSRMRGFVDSVAMRTRLLVIFGTLILVIAAFQIWYFPARQAARAQEDLLLKALATTRLVSHDIGASLDFGDSAGINQVFEGARGDVDLAFLALFAANGSRLAALNGDAAPAAPPKGLKEAVHEFQPGQLVLNVPVLTVGKTSATLVAGFSTARFEANARSSRRGALWAAGVVLLVGMAVTVLMSRQVAARLDHFLGELNRVVTEVRAGSDS